MMPVTQNENKTSKQKLMKQNYLTTSLLPAQAVNSSFRCLPRELLTGNSVYLSTSRGAIWINCMQVFCAKV